MHTKGVLDERFERIASLSWAVVGIELLEIWGDLGGFVLILLAICW